MINDKRLFLLLNLSIWGTYILLSYMIGIVMSTGTEFTQRWLLNTIMCGAVGFGVSCILAFIYNILKSKTKKIYTIIPAVIILSFLFAILWIIIYREGLRFTDSPCYADFGTVKINESIIQSMFVLLAWSSVFFLISYWQELNREKEKSYKMNMLLAQSQFNTLKYQVNPHFLFNALNSVVGLIDEDKGKAKTATKRLSKFFRDSLIDKPLKSSTVEEEFNIVKNYIEIEKIRFEESLIVEYDIPEETLDIRIPPFLIQPLVENAIKYGKKTSPNLLRLWIKIYLEFGSIIIEIKNSGQLIDIEKSNGNGIGIKNLKERLEWQYPDSHFFSLNQDDESVTAKIIIQNIYQLENENTYC